MDREAWRATVAGVKRVGYERATEHSRDAYIQHRRVRLCNPVDWGPPGSSVHGILQAGMPELGARPASRGSS